MDNPLSVPQCNCYYFGTQDACGLPVSESMSSMMVVKLVIESLASEARERSIETTELSPE